MDCFSFSGSKSRGSRNIYEICTYQCSFVASRAQLQLSYFESSHSVPPNVNAHYIRSPWLLCCSNARSFFALGTMRPSTVSDMSMQSYRPFSFFFSNTSTTEVKSTPHPQRISYMSSALSFWYVPTPDPAHASILRKEDPQPWWREIERGLEHPPLAHSLSHSTTARCFGRIENDPRSSASKEGMVAHLKKKIMATIGRGK